MGPYIIANVFILLGPTLFAASIYMTLGRLIRRVHGEHLSPIRVSRLTKTFVWFDVLSFVVQGNSSSLSVMWHAMWGKVCVIVGLAIQLISFSLFWVTAIVSQSAFAVHPLPNASSLVFLGSGYCICYMLSVPSFWSVLFSGSLNMSWAMMGILLCMSGHCMFLIACRWRLSWSSSLFGILIR